jgi:hypothetical protein
VVLTLGDEQYAKGNLDDFQSSYDPTWGALLAITEPAPGNHEGYGDLVGYCAYFGARAHCPGGYHAFDAGAWRVVALNSAPGAISAEQIAFLSNELRNDDGRCQLVYWHHPRWSSGAGHGSDPELENAWAAAVAGGADVVLNGHEHNYERFAPMDADGNESADGTREFVVGTGGASLTPFAVPLPSSPGARDRARRAPLDAVGGRVRLGVHGHRGADPRLRHRLLPLTPRFVRGGAGTHPA